MTSMLLTLALPVHLRNEGAFFAASKWIPANAVSLPRLKPRAQAQARCRAATQAGYPISVRANTFGGIVRAICLAVFQSLD
jgi:hypothetical protein